ncbi:MAG TPA: pentapeptide repeat-containing protein [Blastocatellia bacterium]|nr:pentapeptide repeat-containing protein [Blastocatellia bacterium]
MRWGRLNDSNFLRAELKSTNLRYTQFGNANLERADLSVADLTQSILERSTLTGANLTGALLYATDFTGAVGLTEQQMASARWNEETILPDYLKHLKPKRR